jgi:PAS domain S-box-containing protein
MGNNISDTYFIIKNPSLLYNNNVLEIIEFLPDATFAIDKNNKVIAWNKALEKLTSTTKVEMLGQGDYAYAVPFYGERRPLLIDLVFCPDTKLEKHYSYLKRKKHFVYAEGYAPALAGKQAAYFSAVAAPLFNRNGDTIGAIESIRNITKEKLTEKALKENEEKLQRIVETAVEGIWAIDENYYTKFVNAQMASMLGYDVEEMMGKKVHDLTFAQDLHDQARKMTDLRKGIAHRYERRFERKDGAETWALVSATPLTEEGKFAGSFAMITDITARKQAERKAEENLERFLMLFTYMKCGSVIYQTRNNGNDFIILDMNKSAQTLEAVDETVIGKSVLEVFPEIRKSGLFDVLQRVYRSGNAEVCPAKFSGEQRTGECREYDVFRLPSGEIVALYDDITVQKKSETAIQESEDRFRSTFEQAAVGIAHIDLSGRFLRVNQRYCDICGYTADEMLEQTFQEITWPEDLKHDEREARRLAKGVIQTHSYEKRYIRKDGTTIWINLTASMARNSSGSPLYFIAVIEDISKRKETEDALRQSEEKYRSFFENAIEGIFQSTPDGKFINVNPAMANMHGYDSPQEMLDCITGISKLFFTKPQEWQLFRALIEAQGLVKNFETRSLNKGGFKIWILINARAVRTEKGKTLYFEGTIEDITQLKEGEAALKRYELLSENTREIILFISRDGKILEGNQAAVLAYGYDRETLLSLTIFDLRAPHLRKSLENDLQMTDEESILYETEHIRRDGTIFPVEISARAVYLGREQVFLSIVRDITERKHAEDDLKHTMERLRKAMGGVIDVIVTAVELRDPYTSGHQRRVANLARKIATEMHLPPDQIDGIRMAGVIHDVGKISIPAEILSMPRALTYIEFEMVKTHAETGYQILKYIDFPWPLADIVRQHHEKYDGSGYPLGLKGDEILLEARIIACADVVEAIASHRPYRPSVGIDAALREIEANRGILYDPDVVDACLRLFRERGFQLT